MDEDWKMRLKRIEERGIVLPLQRGIIWVGDAIQPLAPMSSLIVEIEETCFGGALDERIHQMDYSITRCERSPKCLV